MTATRSYHTATLLRDGRVLVTGGSGAGTDSLASAEVYEPTSSSWRAVAPMALARAFHTATLLSDGRVLVAGGQGGGHGPFHREAEIFDPGTGSWSPAGAIEIGRSFHTATLLVDGSVLVTGGQGAAHDASLRDAALYHPDTNAWTPVPSLMAVGRALHTATRLGDGTVLIVGGTSQRQGDSAGALVQSSVELYDPVASRFLPGGALPGPRMAHSTVLLPSGGLAVVGGRSPLQGRPVDTQLYNPRTGTWSSPSPLVRAPETGAQTATLLERAPCGSACGYVLVVADRSTQLWAPPAAEIAAVVTRLKQGGRSSKMPLAALGLVAGGIPAAAWAMARRRRHRVKGPSAVRPTGRAGPTAPPQASLQRHASVVTDQTVRPSAAGRRPSARTVRPEDDAATATARAEAEAVLAALEGGLEALRAGLRPLAELRLPRLLGKVEEEQSRVEQAAAKLAEAREALGAGELADCGRAVADAHRVLSALGGPLSLALAHELRQAAVPRVEMILLEASIAEQARAQENQRLAKQGTVRAGVLATGPVLRAMGDGWAAAAAILASKATPRRRSAARDA